MHGFDYVPENLKSNSFKSTAKNLINVHNGMNNFYNEPLAAKLLASMGTMIPNPAIFECINAIMICLTGNGYGVSEKALPYLNELLASVTITKWELYLKDLSKNTELLYQLGFVKGYDDPVERWCYEIKKRNLAGMTFSDQWIVEFLGRSSVFEVDNVRRMAREQYNYIKS